MPERADEARETSDDTREALLAEAAALWAAQDGAVGPPGDPGRAMGDLPGFLGAYYRLVATDDLATAGPRRVAAVAAWNAALGESRPQGRAVVQVRESGAASLTGAGTVVDIVTDDMPYLVDSVTMELNRHQADIRLIVHPLLTVHRDVAGMAHGTVLANLGAELPAGTVAESWIHVELGQLSQRETLAADLRRVLDDLRVAMEDQRRMRSAARELVATLTGAGGLEEEEAGELLAWLSAGHFTFLGYREYELHRHGEEPELRPVPGTGLGILRHDGADSFDATPPGGLHGARTARLLVLAKSSTRSTVYRPSYMDYVAVRKFGADGQPTRGVPVPRPVHAGRLHRVDHPDPGAAAQAGRDARGGRAARRQPRRERPHRAARGLSARGAVRDQRGAADPDRARRAPAGRAQAGPAVPAARRLRPVHVLPGLPAQGPLHHAGQAARPGDLAQGAARRLRRLQRDGQQLRARPPARGGARGAGPPAARRSTRSRCRPRSRPRSAPGTRTSPRRQTASSASSVPTGCCSPAASASRRPTRRT